MCAGRWLEPAGNGRPRGMVAIRHCVAVSRNRIRPIDLLHFFYRRCDANFAYDVACWRTAAIVHFYTHVLGMNLLRTTDRQDQQYSLAFVGFGRGNEDGHAEIELTYNYGVSDYEMGSAYGHIAIAVPDAAAACARIQAAGGQVTRPAGPVKGGSTVIAFVQDPDGYKIELIERAGLAA